MRADFLFQIACSKKTRGNGFKLKDDRFRPEINMKTFFNDNGHTLAKVAQRGGGCPNTGNIQGQFGDCCEQLGLVEDIPAYCRGFGLDDL